MSKGLMIITRLQLRSPICAAGMEGFNTSIDSFFGSASETVSGLIYAPEHGCGTSDPEVLINTAVFESSEAYFKFMRGEQHLDFVRRFSQDVVRSELPSTIWTRVDLPLNMDRIEQLREQALEIFHVIEQGIERLSIFFPISSLKEDESWACSTHCVWNKSQV